MNAGRTSHVSTTSTDRSYDRLWRTTWGDMQRLGPVHRHAREDLVRTVAALNVRTVLDVGCGSGDNLQALAETGRYELSGVDVSPEALGMARERVPEARFEVLDVQREALAQKFDLVMSLQVIEHLLDDTTALRHIAAMARHYVFVATIQGRMRRSELAIGHIRNYSAVELRRKLEAAGVEILWMKGWGFPFYSPLYRSAIEWIPGGPPGGAMGSVSRIVAEALYQLYRLNWPGRGDVISALARPVE
jgi:2-polyprenyl-3-methyl-5-hydroxy-6-metoxy-1,4-benzoquinol methylase